MGEGVDLRPASQTGQCPGASDAECVAKSLAGEQDGARARTLEVTSEEEVSGKWRSGAEGRWWGWDGRCAWGVSGEEWVVSVVMLPSKVRTEGRKC